MQTMSMKEQMLMESQDKTILMKKQLKCCKLFNLEYFTNKRMKIYILEHLNGLNGYLQNILKLNNFMFYFLAPAAMKIKFSNKIRMEN